MDINHPKLLEIGADLIMGPEKKKELFKGTIEIAKTLPYVDENLYTQLKNLKSDTYKVFKQLLTRLEDENRILSTLVAGF